MRSKNGLLVGMIALVLIAGAAAYHLLDSPETTEGSAVGSVAPDITTKTIDGQPWRLRDQAGKVVLMDFWATWCGPCVASMPHMKQLYDKFKSNPDFTMVGVTLDNDAVAPKQFVQTNHIPWLQLFDVNQPLARQFRVTGIPSVWVFGRDGRVAGSQLDPDDIESTVAKALARKKS